MKKWVDWLHLDFESQVFKLSKNIVIENMFFFVFTNCWVYNNLKYYQIIILGEIVSFCYHIKLCSLQFSKISLIRLLFFSRVKGKIWRISLWNCKLFEYHKEKIFDKGWKLKNTILVRKYYNSARVKNALLKLLKCFHLKIFNYANC